MESEKETSKGNVCNKYDMYEDSREHINRKIKPKPGHVWKKLMYGHPSFVHL